MTGQESFSTVDDNRMAIVLLQILRNKKIINQPTYEKTNRKYKERLREAA